MRKILNYIWFITTLIYGYQVFAETSSETMSCQRIKLFFLLKDPQGALETCNSAIAQFPQSLEIKKLYLQALSQSGHSLYALQLWEDIKSELSDAKERSRIQEYIAWGILSTGESSSQIAIKNFSLFNSFQTQDARVSEMILHALNSSNALERALAVKLAAKYGDTLLHQFIIKLLRTEKS